MWELDHKEDWVLKNWCFPAVVLEKALDSPLNSKEIKPVNTKRNQPWIFIRKTDAETEAPILWLPDAKNWLMGKDPDAGKNWGRGEKGATEDVMVEWYHWLNGDEFEQIPGDNDVREAWSAAVHGVTKSWTWLEHGRDWTQWKQRCVTRASKNTVLLNFSS